MGLVKDLYVPVLNTFTQTDLMLLKSIILSFSLLHVCLVLGVSLDRFC